MSEVVSKQPSVPQLLNKPVIQTSGTYVPPLPPSSNNAKETTLKEVPTAKTSKSQKRPLEGSQNGMNTPPKLIHNIIKAGGVLYIMHAYREDCSSLGNSVSNYVPVQKPTTMKCIYLNTPVRQ